MPSTLAGWKAVACEVSFGTEKRAALEAKLASYRPLLLSAAPPLGVGHGLLLITATVAGRVTLVGRLAGEMGLAGRVVAARHGSAREAVCALCSRPPFASPVRAARTADAHETPLFEPVFEPAGPAFRDA